MGGIKQEPGARIQKLGEASLQESSSYSSSSSSSIGFRSVMCDTQRPEGSRFVTRQLYRLAASGSRERFLASQLYRQHRVDGPKENSAWRNSRWAVNNHTLRSHSRTRTTTSTRTITILAATPLLAPGFWLLQASLTRSRFLARYERPEKRVNMTATESTMVPTSEAMVSAVGER